MPYVNRMPFLLDLTHTGRSPVILDASRQYRMLLLQSAEFALQYPPRILGLVMNDAISLLSNFSFFVYLRHCRCMTVQIDESSPS